MVDVLFCERGGPYFDLLGEAHCWDRERDAITYAGSGPVICHPDCGPWGRLRHLYRGKNHDHALFALATVRRVGGCLEHPAGSLLWRARALPQPGEIPDQYGGYTIEICQCDWGHPARKRTWLYLIGIPRDALTLPARREPTHWISGGRGRVGKKAKTTPVPPGIKVCSAQQRRRTPIEFARWLIALAEQAGKSRAA